MSILQVSGDFEVLADPHPYLMKIVKEDKFAAGSEVSELVIEYVEALEDMEEEIDALLEGHMILMEESILLLFDEVGEGSEGGAHLPLPDIGAVVYTDYKGLVNPSKVIDVELVLNIGDIGHNDTLLEVHALVAHVEVELLLPVHYL